MFEFDLLVILVFIGHVINGLAWGERYPTELPWLLALPPTIEFDSLV